MKKLNILFLTAVLVSVFAAPSFAMLRKDLDSVKGTVVFVNAARTEITIKDSATGKDKTFTSAGIAPTISSGSPVIILYKKGTSNAKTIRLIKKSMPAAMAPAPAKTYAAPAAPAPAKESKYGW